jgi:hypothetical protein
MDNEHHYNKCCTVSYNVNYYTTCKTYEDYESIMY